MVSLLTRGRLFQKRPQERAAPRIGAPEKTGGKPEEEKRMKEVILCKYGEVVLKGLNKSWFEGLLLRELRRRMEKFGEFEVTAAQSAAVCTPVEGVSVDLDGAYEEAKKIFGFSGVSRAAAVEKDVDAITSCAAEYLPRFLRDKKTFKVEGKRSDKRFPLNSMQLAAEVGGVILSACPWLRVDVREPEAVVRVEVRERHAFVNAGQEKGAGGMPVGSNGRALLLLSGGIDSPVAGYMMARRGVRIYPLHFESFPYTSERAREKVLELARIMSDRTGQLNVRVVSLTRIQEELRDNCEEAYFTLLLRRFMVRIACAVADRLDCQGLITGENIGQVASQTMAALGVTNSVADRPIFRPLIAYDKNDIVAVAREIGTFETSILPYEDCCTVFTPRHPKTRPDPVKVEEQERRVDVDALCREALGSLTEYKV